MEINDYQPKEEYVYVLSNPSFDENLLKIGFTRKNPSERAEELCTTGLPTPFVVECFITTTNGSKLEKVIHKYLKEYRESSTREFFRINKEKLFNILKNELKLELRFDLYKKKNYNEISGSKYKTINKINNEIKNLDKKLLVPLNKLKQNNTELRYEEENGKIVKVNIYHLTPEDKEYNYNLNCLSMGFDEWENTIIRRWEGLERELNKHKDTLDYILNFTELIINKIGIKQFCSDNIEFKKLILKTECKLNLLLSDYNWTF
jgi:hypothetical protein